MAPPANISAATAIDITSLPFSTTQDVYDAGTTYTVWYKYTAQSGDDMIGLWGYGDFTGNYIVRTHVYQGPEESLLSWLPITDDRPTQFPVTIGTTYFVSFEKRPDLTPTSATLNLNVLKHTESDDEDGYFFNQAFNISSDYNATPMASVLSAETDQTVNRYIRNIVIGEAGDRLADGTIILSEAYTSPHLEIYNSSYASIATISFSVGDQRSISAHHPTNTFWAGGTGYNPAIKEYSSTGTELSSRNLTSGIAGLGVLTVNNAGNVLYFAQPTPGMPIWRKDLVTGVESIFASSVSLHILVDGIVLPDDTILVSYIEAYNPTPPNFVRRYNSAGTILQTYDLGILGNFMSRMNVDINDPDYFHYYSHPTPGTAMARIDKVRISDGVVVRSRYYTNYVAGAYASFATATPIARFGFDSSCPIIVLSDEGGNGNGNGDEDAPGGLYTSTQPGVSVLKHDRYYGDVNKKIPNPTVKTGYFGE